MRAARKGKWDDDAVHSLAACSASVIPKAEIGNVVEEHATGYYITLVLSNMWVSRAERNNWESGIVVNATATTTMGKVNKIAFQVQL